MDNRKRPRLEVAQNTLNAATTIKTSLPVATIAGQSFFLSTNANDCVGTSNNNVLLTICAENSDESTEYLSLDESLAQIKQEEEMAALQYRIVNPLRSALDGSAHTSTASAMLPTTTVQLPSGCDIYLVKEYVDDESVPQQHVAVEATSNVKMDASVGSSNKLVHTNNATSLLPKPAGHSAAGTAVYATEPHTKRSYILETYKKRDDKRRATHNEVERRRRDKINSWIFKLKEMLPDMPHVSNANNSNNNTSITAAAPTALAAPERISNHSRTPPSDSKSQILIKACEYIRTMQEELKSLRECLSENESLRSSNQRLQNELDKLKKNEDQNHDFSGRSINNNNNNNKNYNVTLNSLNSNGSIFGVSTPAATAASYPKRELIIRDYVD